RRSGGLSLTTAEGDKLTLMNAHYGHAALTEICQILTEADDFGLDDDLEAEPDGTLHFPWFETDPDKPGLFTPIGRRVLANLTLTPDTLEVGAMSQERMERCSQRLEQLLGQRIYLTMHEIKPSGRRRRAAKPALPKSTEPITPPPEFIAKLEEQMLRQWLDEKIPALDGKTPRQAVKTP
ncbi:MAG: hypothetical protein GY803_14870, partial [Chloroflexi bacterium]|nr:hypothetical protein [Chloroflexota bacterium]